MSGGSPGAKKASKPAASGENGRAKAAKALTTTASLELVVEMNSTLAVLREPVGAILVEGGRNGFQLATPYEVEILLANKPNAPPGGWVRTWLAYEGRREFTRISFQPGKDKTGEGDSYNVWQGWGVKPKKGPNLSVFWDFVKNTICAGDVALYQYLRKWMAHAVQKPAVMPRVALLLHSIEGAGKGTLVNWFAPIFGRHFFTATSLDNVLGHFNSHLGTALLVFANEAVWGGDKRQQGRMKALITDPTTDVTKKHKDTITLDNFKRWIFASNSDHPVPIDRTDRRFVIFEVSENRKGDYDFFNQLEELRTHGGVEALMSDLMNEDISEFNPERDRPRSGLAPYKMQSGSNFDQWAHTALEKAEIRVYDRGHDCYAPWNGLVPKNIIYDSYNKSAHGVKLSDSVFWTKMRKIGLLKGRDKRPAAGSGETRQREVELKDVDEARAAFARYMGDAVDLWMDACDLPEPCKWLNCWTLKTEPPVQPPSRGWTAESLIP